MKKGSKPYIVVFIKGMMMGIADIIPGVSGGTIAIITGIYEEFLFTLNNLDLNVLKLFKKGKFKEVLNKYNLLFLLSLTSGILSSIFLLSHSIVYLIENYPILLWSFFLGLITSSIFYLFKEINKWTKKVILFNLLGIGISLLVLTLNPSSQEVNPAYLFICGMISITAMLLPGVSGAYILILLGAYETMLKTIKEIVSLNSEYFLNFLSFVMGALLSVKLFSKLLTWSYNKHKNYTLSCLVGFMIGSLPSLWPWKSESITDELLFYKLYIPENSFMNSEFISGLIFFIFGFVLVLIIDYLGKKYKNV
jgi:putative membrane protein